MWRDTLYKKDINLEMIGCYEALWWQCGPKKAKLVEW